MRGAFPSRHIPISVITFGCSKESIIFNSFISLLASVFVYSAALKVLVKVYTSVWDNNMGECQNCQPHGSYSVLRKTYSHYARWKYVYGYYAPDPSPPQLHMCRWMWVYWNIVKNCRYIVYYWNCVLLVGSSGMCMLFITFQGSYRIFIQVALKAQNIKLTKMFVCCMFKTAKPWTNCALWKFNTIR